MQNLSEFDQKLLRLLTEDARVSVADLARALGASRLTVQSHMQRLEQQKVIQGYTVRLHGDYTERQIGAHMLIATDQKMIGPVVRALEKIDEIRTLHSISGEYDLVAELRANSTRELDQAMDRITQIKGVNRGHSSVLLSQKFSR
ncbi:Lrp/AsnC family transcriptional regulator [Pseudomaricurvus alkylphenolicus]|jgi:DNA-binding Lrp family transcriptional regulator|uniref:Lrp/AsnC family transcriptional regulator n=1 Tax=Pseudomaricurvus alkylphenolicus TaxID=1306991 RepID=UPI001421AD8D|nr:Lrp/AsnC family transcriptional regulator [Pseudomaricurvus alkylphenolicus]NIB40091.1 Lrp/AsnC family transcriptional regulator [Pseudomaricurvus alkylphenolicus]